MSEIKIDVPLFVRLTKKTPKGKKIINLNNYRNWHFIVNSKAKIAYSEQLKEVLSPLKFKKRISLHFVLFKGSKRKSDRANVLSIHEKFFCDALTHYGCIPDDDDEVIESTHYSGGGLDRENPRVEVYIKLLK